MEFLTAGSERMSNVFEAPIIQDIARIMPELSGSQKSVAAYVLENAFQAASNPIDVLARESGVSTASVNRFACALGYAGYGAFRQSLLQVFKPSVRHLENLRHEVDKGASAFDVTQASFGNAAELVSATSGRFSNESVNRAVEMIASARAVYCLGLGLSTLLADMAALRFTPYCGHIHSITRHGGQENAMYSLQKINEGDLLIALSFPRYSKETIRLTRFARSRKAGVLTFTDKPSSPLVSLADHSLLVGSSHPTLYISLVGAVAAIEAVASALAMRKPNVLEETAALTEQLLPYFYFEFGEEYDNSAHTKAVTK
jgi:DNA-binding MurR/RpiR family transcriptional regulator